jgi:two-component system, cell cycle sensor histidine kinase and response regulator CckA
MFPREFSVYVWIAAAVVVAPLVALLGMARRQAARHAQRIADLERDIVGRECIERQLQASQSNLQMATEASGVGTWYWDLQTDEMFCSEQAVRLFGLQPTARSFRSAEFITLIHPDDQDRVQATLESTFRDGGLYHVEYRIVPAEGKTTWLATSARGLTDGDGNVRRLAGITVDVTDRKRLEENFYQAQKLEAVGRLAGGVAHDFNNMLGVISAYAELLMEEPGLSTAATKRVTEIMNATQRANALTRQLLAFSRKQVIQPTTLDLNAVILGVKDMLQRLVGEDIRVVTDLAPKLPSIKADRSQLEQVLLNFAANSRDAMPRGGRFELKSSVQLVPPDVGRSLEGETVLLEIRDTGCGMSPEVIQHVFEPFFTTKASGRGTGLGLATVYGVVEQLRGIVTVDSTVDVGTTFRISLPTVAGVAAVEPVTARKANAASCASVLLVEDETSLREVLSDFIESAGMRVFAAGDGRDALQKIASGEHIDVLLTDLVMPEMDGRTLAQEARARRPGLHVIYMSGHTDDTLTRKDLLGEGLSYLQKPFTRADLVKAINSVMTPVA